MGVKFRAIIAIILIVILAISTTVMLILFYFEYISECEESTTMQSPINLISTHTVENTGGMTMKKIFESLDKNFTFLSDKTDFHFTSHDESSSTIELNLGSINSGKYKVDGFHFHWQSDKNGSEHSINKKYSASEIHIITYNSIYDSFYDAMGYVNGLTIFGVLIDEDDSVSENEKWTKNLHYINKQNAVGTNISFNLRHLFPNKTNDKYPYFTYIGSLTTAPFTEHIQWVVFKDTIKLKKNQIDYLREHSGHRRDIQDINSRKITLCNDN